PDRLSDALRLLSEVRTCGTLRPMFWRLWAPGARSLVEPSGPEADRFPKPRHHSIRSGRQEPTSDITRPPRERLFEEPGRRQPPPSSRWRRSVCREGTLAKPMVSVADDRTPPRVDPQEQTYLDRPPTSASRE